MRDDRVQPIPPDHTGKGGQTRYKQEEINVVRVIKVHDLRQDGKRRIVDHDRTVRIRHFLIVAARIKRPHDRTACQAVLVNRPDLDRLVHWCRRVAVIRGFLRLEFIDKRLVFLGFLARLGRSHSGLKCFGGQRRGVRRIRFGRVRF